MEEKPSVKIQYQVPDPAQEPQKKIEEQHGLIPSTSSTPTFTPRKFSEQFRPKGTEFCFYDTASATWTCIGGGGVHFGLVENNGSASLGTPSPSGWSVVRNGTGDVTITHNLGTTSYIVVCTSKGTASVMSPQSPGSNSIQIASYSLAGSLQDTDFFFALYL